MFLIIAAMIYVYCYISVDRRL